jgi:hypothetical protein
MPVMNVSHCFLNFSASAREITSQVNTIRFSEKNHLLWQALCRGRAICCMNPLPPSIVELQMNAEYHNNPLQNLNKCSLPYERSLTILVTILAVEIYVACTLISRFEKRKHLLQEMGKNYHDFHEPTLVGFIQQHQRRIQKSVHLLLVQSARKSSTKLAKCEGRDSNPRLRRDRCLKPTP